MKYNLYTYNVSMLVLKFLSVAVHFDSGLFKSMYPLEISCPCFSPSFAITRLSDVAIILSTDLSHSLSGSTGSRGRIRCWFLCIGPFSKVKGLLSISRIEHRGVKHLRRQPTRFLSCNVLSSSHCRLCPCRPPSLRLHVAPPLIRQILYLHLSTRARYILQKFPIKILWGDNSKMFQHHVTHLAVFAALEENRRNDHPS